MQSNITRLEDKLKTLFKQEEAFVVSIIGAWGIGKTYFWNNFAKHNLQDKTVAYVSLFGKESIKDILTDIMMQTSPHFKNIKSLKKLFGSTKFAGIDLASAFSLGKPDDFSSIIVCFDDFERSSDKLNDKDILGLISQLKESKECKVVMIYNQDEMNSSVFSRYKDKIIDFELYYRPTVAESFSCVKSKLRVFEYYALDYFERKGITNIRIMKRAINALNDFSFIERHVKGYSHTERDIADNILIFSVVNAKYQKFDFADTLDYAHMKYSSNEKLEINDEKENMLYFLDLEGIRPKIGESKLRDNIYSYIKSSFVEKETLIEIVNNEKQDTNLSEAISSVNKIKDKFRYDLHYDNASYSADIFCIYKDYKNSIINKLGIISFLHDISEISTIDSSNKDKYHAFGLECAQGYLNSHRDLKTLDNDTRCAIIEFDSTLETSMDKLINSQNKKKTFSKEEIIELMKSPKRNRGYGIQPELLKSVTVDTYREYMSSDAGFLKNVMQFIQWTKNFHGDSGFEEAVEQQVKALRAIKSYGDETAQFKVGKILKYLGF